MSDARWWEVHGPLLTQVMPAHEFPLAGRVGAAVGSCTRRLPIPTAPSSSGWRRCWMGSLLTADG